MVARPRKRRVVKRRVSRRKQRGSGFFNDTVLPNLPELHYRGFDTGFKKYNFAGPGTRLDRRLNADKTPKEWSKPVNRVDEAAYNHDLAYEKYADEANRAIADSAMIDALEKVRKDPNGRWTERLDALIVEGAIRAKRQLGINSKKKRPNQVRTKRRTLRRRT